MGKNIYFYFDDSGVLHKNHDNEYFVYAGFVFESKESKEGASRKYRNAVKNIKRKTNRNDEIKSFGLKNSHRRSLYNVLRFEQSLSAAVHIPRVYDHILGSKKSIHRYKDYVLKRIVKSKLQELIAMGNLNASDDINIHIFVDEQATASDGFYSLRDSIYEEIKKGISNYDYGTFHKPLFTGNVEINVEFCDSKSNYLIQASDILANRIWCSYIKDNAKLRNIPNHKHLLFP